MKRKKILLAIGGHDPTGGAGISADIETSAYFNYHVLSILTCTTVQNTGRVQKIYKIPKNYIIESFKEIIKEFKIDVIKIGLLPNIQCSKEVLKILINQKTKNRLRRIKIQFVNTFIIIVYGRRLFWKFQTNSNSI